MNDKIWHLRRINLFKRLRKPVLEQINSESSMTTIPKKQVIYFNDDPSRNIYFLKTGKVKLIRVDENGQEMILDIINAGEPFGENALFNEERRSDIAVSMDDCLLCSINKDRFEEIARNSPGLNIELVKFVGFRMRKFRHRLEMLTFKDARQRLMELVKELSEQYGRKTGSELFIRNFLTHEEMGELTGLKRQTVSTILNDLKKEGLIRFNRKHIILPEPHLFFKRLQ